MSKLKEDQLIPLRDALNELMDFVKEFQWKEIPYFYRFLDYMKNNIEFCVCTHSDDMEQLEEILLRDWKKANNMYLGIPSYKLFSDNGQDMTEMYCQYISLLEKIDRYITYREFDIKS